MTDEKTRQEGGAIWGEKSIFAQGSDMGQVNNLPVKYWVIDIGAGAKTQPEESHPEQG